MKKMITALLVLVLALSADIINITDDGNGTGTTTWTSDNTYVIDGFVFVNSGQELTIEAGTVIKANPGEGADASALIVAKGGKIFAEGTKENPIIFTSIADDFSAPLNQKGLWGGLLILGDAKLNTAESEGQIEGIPETEPRGAYGGGNDEDNSGVLKYISIRYGGTEIGAGNEINGLTLGGVGSNTVFDHIEVVWNKDDGVEFFGGKPNLKHVAVAFCGDDSFDYDEGFRGQGQYWFSLQGAGPGEGDRAGEHDGGTDPEDGTPFAIPTIMNVTYIGSGMSGANEDNMTFKIRDNAGGHYSNSIFYDFTKRAIDIEDLESGADSRERLDEGDLTFTSNLWYNCGSNDIAAMCKHDFEQILFTDAARHNDIVDPGFISISRTNDANLNPRPISEVAKSNLAAPANEWFDATSYKGAFDPSDETELWLAGWSYLSEFGYLDLTVDIEESPIVASDVEILGNYPNPFNPTTELRFNVIKSGEALIRVFNTNGELVDLLFSGNLAKGIQSFTFDATGLNSGSYIYQIKTNNGTQNRKMVLVK